MLRRLIVLCFLLFAGFAVAYAQETASIHGKVTDSSGAAIANATVSLTDLTTTNVVHTTTGADGRFVFQHGQLTVRVAGKVARA